MTAASTSLPGEPASVPAARRFVRTTLQALGLSAASDAVELLVSELVTNAVLHARTPFTVAVLRDGDVLRVSVTDASAAQPRQRSYGTDSTTGRGLRLVATLALAWGVDRTSTGKTVWFEVGVGGGPGADGQAQDDGRDVDALLAAFDDDDDDDADDGSGRGDASGGGAAPTARRDGAVRAPGVAA